MPGRSTCSLTAITVSPTPLGWVRLSLSSVSLLSLAGFYVVNTIQRDREIRVGRILAATPLSKSFYTLGKALSDSPVLGAIY